MDGSEDYFWRKPTEIQTFYHFRWLGYVIVISFILGALQFFVGLLMLIHKGVISPINMILLHYFGNLLLAGFTYQPRTYHELFRAKLCAIPEHNTYEWELISWCSLMASATFRSFSVWMALMAGIWRYLGVKHPLKERKYCTMENTLKCILFGYVAVFLTSLPLYFATGVGPVVKLFDQDGCQTTNFSTGKSVTIYEFQLYLENYPISYYICMGFFGFEKLVPSGILAFISVRLIAHLFEAKRRRKEMVSASELENTRTSGMKRQMRPQTDRSTYILVAIVVLFMIGEVPHGIYSVLAAFYGPRFFWNHWYYAMEIVNSISHFAEIFHLFIYFSLSQETRKIFRDMFNKSFNT